MSKQPTRPAAIARRGAVSGFTMIELLIVVALIAIASAVASLALRDPSATQLEREGARLVALLEAARAEARASGVAVQWVPNTNTGNFQFVGLPATLGLPGHWLGDGVRAEIANERGLVPGALLGPEPVIGMQRIVLHLDAQRLTLSTDGLGPFAIVGDDALVNATP